MKAIFVLSLLLAAVVLAAAQANNSLTEDVMLIVNQTNNSLNENGTFPADKEDFQSLLDDLTLIANQTNNSRNENATVPADNLQKFIIKIPTIAISKLFKVFAMKFGHNGVKFLKCAGIQFMVECLPGTVVCLKKPNTAECLELMVCGGVDVAACTFKLLV